MSRWRIVAPQLTALAVSLACLTATTTLCAQELDTVQIAKAVVGFEGRYRLGHWTPVLVTLKGGSQSSEVRVGLILPDGEGLPSQVNSPKTVQIPSGQTVDVLVYGKFGRPQGPLTVVVSPTSGTTIEKTLEGNDVNAALPVGSELFLTLGSPVDVEAGSRLDLDGGSNCFVQHLVDLQHLPERWFGYEGVDAIVVALSKRELPAELSTEQVAAIEEWVTMGGRLVITAGESSSAVLSDQSPLLRLIPGNASGRTVSLRQTGAIEGYADAGKPIGSPVTIVQFSNLRGVIQSYEGQRSTDLPLVIREPRGFGEVVFVPFALDEPPISTWADRGRLFNKLLRRSSVTGGNLEGASQTQVMHAGYNDLSGQLRSSLDQFTDVPLVPFWMVASLIGLYIAIIGPLDYFVVRRILNRMELTWLSFPLTVLIFSGLAIAIAAQYKPREVRLNQVDLIDVEQATGLSRGTTWLNVLSPANQSYNLKLQPSPAGTDMKTQPKVLFSWMGLPGAALGGMENQAANAPAFSRPYQFNRDLDGLKGVPIPVWSTKGFTGRWKGELQSGFTGELKRDEYGAVAGKLTNSLDAPLRDCLLFYERWAYRLDEIKPGASVSIGPQLYPRTVETMLTRRRIVGEKDLATPYDQFDLDVNRILEMMMFHEAAGGTKYTRLMNRYQRFLDLSSELQLGRAILVGRIDAPSAEVLNDESELSNPKDLRKTYYRFIFDVAPYSP